MMPSRQRFILALALLAVPGLMVIAAACGGDDDGEPAATDTPSSSAEPTATPSDDFDLEIGTLTGRLLFSKSELTAPANEPFTVTYDNTDGGLPHNFSIHEDQEAAKDPASAIALTPIEPGPIVQMLDVPALEPGEYYFQCDVHPTTMMGTLRVIE